MKKRDHERRRHPRVSGVDIEATVVTGDGAVTCSIESLSAGGARLVGGLRVAVGEEVRVLLGPHAPGSGTLDARVLRTEHRGDGTSAVALMFRDAAPDTEDAIQRLVLRWLEREHASTDWVLVLDDDASIRAAIGRDLRALGFATRAMAAPLELLRGLEDPALNPMAAFIDLCLCHEDGANVLSFLSDDYPHIRRVVMSGTRHDELERCVDSERAHAFVHKPWNRRALARALGACGQ
jgi:two-component system chemotaxis response regulator CheY